MQRQRDELVDRLRATGIIRSPRIEAAFRTIQREIFLPDEFASNAYANQAIVTLTNDAGEPISSSSEPGIIAVMLEQLELHEGQRVLEIGTGSGYNAALIRELVGATGRVTTIDIEERVVTGARHGLDGAGLSDVVAVTGDGWLGAPTETPFDRIEVTAGAADLAPAWRAQLVDEGIVVAPLLLRQGIYMSVALKKDGDDGWRSMSMQPCGFMPLRGPNAELISRLCVGEWTLQPDAPSEPSAHELLTELLSSSPRSETPFGLNWLGLHRLACTEPASVVLRAPGALRAGIFLPTQRSLALADVSFGPRSGVLRTYGDSDAAGARFRSFLQRSSPLQALTTLWPCSGQCPYRPMRSGTSSEPTTALRCS